MVYNRNVMAYAPYAGSLMSRIVPRGGTKPKFARSYNTTTVRKTTKRKSASSLIKQVLNNDKPAKHRTQYTGISCLHNLIYSISPTQLIVQGDTNQDRDGDVAQLAALKVNGTIFADSVANGYCYRILVGYSGEEYNLSAGVLSVSGLVESEIFLPATGSGHRTAAIVNPKAFTCLYDEVIDINSLLSGVVDVHSYSLTVPLGDHKFNYQSTASQYGKTKNLYVIFLGSCAGGTIGVTAIGSTQMSFDLIFK